MHRPDDRPEAHGDRHVLRRFVWHGFARWPALHVPLSPLRAPERDVNALDEVLADPATGGFEVTRITNRPVQELRIAGDDFLLVPYCCFSGAHERTKADADALAAQLAEARRCSPPPTFGTTAQPSTRRRTGPSLPVVRPAVPDYRLALAAG